MVRPIQKKFQFENSFKIYNCVTELLRHSAEHCLKDIVQLLFSRLPLFDESLLDVNVGNYTVNYSTHSYYPPKKIFQ